jgi:hypothetical protein
VQNTLGLTGIGLFDPGRQIWIGRLRNGWRLRGGGAGTAGDGRRRQLVGNRINTISTTVSIAGCTGRTRVLRETRLGDQVGEMEPGKGRWRRHAVAELRRDIARARRRRNNGKKGQRRCPPPRGASSASGGDGVAAER